MRTSMQTNAFKYFPYLSQGADWVNISNETAFWMVALLALVSHKHATSLPLGCRTASRATCEQPTLQNPNLDPSTDGHHDGIPASAKSLPSCIFLPKNISDGRFLSEHRVTFERAYPQQESLLQTSQRMITQLPLDYIQ